jgi:pyrimidine-nucleoside phosphorylase/thymidine phosphorylase
MDVRAIIRTKRDGGELAEAEIRAFLAGYVADEVPEYQAAALLAAIFIRGMGAAELERWTRGMLATGTALDFAGLGRPVVDKHSTGGVGDKVSLALAPALAACGAAVPMISGRGLGHTGGTLDKLESIPGFRTDLAVEEIQRAVRRRGLALAAQTAEIAPADRRLYALRDAAGLVESIPLIASSILSKKLAEGLQALVLDVKFGSGAFLAEPERGRELARVMQRLAQGMGIATSAYQTAMDRPLGRAVGNALEVAEAFECLEGAGPGDLRQLVGVLGGEALALAGLASDAPTGRARIERALGDGSAREALAGAIAEQHGDPACLDDPARLPSAPGRAPWLAERSGRLGFRDVRAIGVAVAGLGGGRARLGDGIDPAVGLVFHRAAGDEVHPGELLATIHHRDGRGLERCYALLAEATVIGPEVAEPGPLVLARHGPDPV